MSRRGLVAAIGGAAQGFQQLWLKNYEQQLKEQEEKAKEEREERRRQREREQALQDRAGTPLYKPERIPGDSEYRALAYGPDGRAVEMQSFGQAPQGILNMEQMAIQQQMEDRQRKIRLDEARIGAAERRARGGGSGGGKKSLTPGQEREAQNQAVNEAIEAAGYYKKGGRWYETVPVLDTDEVEGVRFITGETEEKAVPQRRIAEIRQEVKGGILSSPRRESAAADTGGVPEPKTQAEYDKLPSGTVFIAPDGTQRVKP